MNPPRQHPPSANLPGGEATSSHFILLPPLLPQIDARPRSDLSVSAGVEAISCSRACISQGRHRDCGQHLGHQRRCGHGAACGRRSDAHARARVSRAHRRIRRNRLRSGDDGLGPVGAIRRLCEIAGWNLADVDAVEINEAFAAQALGCVRELNLDMEKLNQRGGAIALRHRSARAAREC
jgi:hypothetical protein